MRRHLALLALLSLPACAVATKPVATTYTGTRTDFAFPWTGSAQISLTGQDLIRKGSFHEMYGGELASPATIGGTVLSAGFYPRLGEDTRYSYHTYRTQESKDGFGYLSARRSTLGGWASAPHAIRIDKVTGETCLLAPHAISPPCSSNLAFTHIRREHLSDKDLQQKLIFLGVAGDQVLLRYWENSGHYARGEKTENFSVPLGSLPSVVSHHGARLRLIEANRTSVRYQLLETFPSHWTEKRPEVRALVR